MNTFFIKSFSCIVLCLFSLSILPLEASSIVQNPNPNINNGNPVSLCNGGFAELNPDTNPDYGYLWSTNETTPTITVATPGIYWVDVTNSCGTERDSVEVSSAVLASGFDIFGELFFCDDGFTTLDVSDIWQSVSWSNGDSGPSTLINEAGFYTVTVVNDCGQTLFDSVEVEAIVGEAPTVNIVSNQDYLCLNLSQEVPLQAILSDNVETIVWNTGATTPIFIVGTPGEYIATVFTACGTAAADTFVVIKGPDESDQADLGADFILCEGDTIRLDSGIPLSVYNWSTGATSRRITVTEPGAYSVSVTTVCGITSSDEIVIEENKTPVVDLGPDLLICNQESTILRPQEVLGDYQWSTGDIGSELLVEENGEYILSVTNNCGLTGSDTVMVEFQFDDQDIIMPNAFSPNGDGINDKLYNLGNNTSTSGMRIINRWGQLLYQTDDPVNGWDGEYKSKPQPVGVYKYIIDFQGCEGSADLWIGDVLLVR